MYTAEGVSDVLADAVRRAAEPVLPGELISQQIDRAARRVHLPRGLVKKLWYREQRSVPAHIALSLLAFDRRTEQLRQEIEHLQSQLDALR